MCAASTVNAISLQCHSGAVTWNPDGNPCHNQRNHAKQNPAYSEAELRNYHEILCIRTPFRYFTMYSSLFIYWVYTEFYLSHITSQHIKHREKVKKNLRDLPIRAIFPIWNKFLMSFLFLYTALMESLAYSSRRTTHRGQELILIQHYIPRTKNGIYHKLNA